MLMRRATIAVAVVGFAVLAAACSSTAPAAPSPGPANGGTFPNAAAILAKLTASGLACTAPSQMAEDAATLFEPGATSLITCSSPSGTAADTYVTVFDTAAHQQAYEKQIETSGGGVAGGQLVGVNWVIETTPAYAASAKARLGGVLTVIPAVTVSASASPTGTALLLESAGPLAAHIVDGNRVVCDQDTAYWSPDGHGGVIVQTYLAGAGLMNIVATGKDHAADMSQEYTKGTREGRGHQFDLVGLASGNVNEIDYSVTAQVGGSGTCQVAALAQ